jgi:hypothetical protein
VSKGISRTWPSNNDIRIQPIRVHVPLRITTRIRIHTRPIDEPERVGLGVAARGRIIVAVPVVVQAGLELIPLAGQTVLVRQRTGDRMRANKVSEPELVIIRVGLC